MLQLSSIMARQASITFTILAILPLLLISHAESLMRGAATSSRGYAN